MKTIERQNWVKVGEPEAAAMRLTMTDGHIIDVEIDESTIIFGWNTDRKADIKKLYDIYVSLSNLTFETRLAHYEADIRQHGYFVVGECRFYPYDRIVFRKREFPLGTSDFLLNGVGAVEMRKKDFGWLDWLKCEFSFSKKPHFPVLTDKDVLFFLLRKYFGLAWRA
jgi:hypothetical protein